jgi:hypothetical protein
MRCGAGRPGWHVKSEHCRRLDVRRWHREGLLRPGTSMGWIWTDRETGERLASIGVSVADERVTLRYSINDVPITQQVPLDRTSCTYGGTRSWFHCPRCTQRVAVLFLRANGFACRRCQGIAYSSQSEDMTGRAWRRQAKLEARLGPNWQRPKGMHRSTRDNLLDRIFACELVREEALARYLAAHPF